MFPIIDDYFLFLNPVHDFTIRPLAKLCDIIIWETGLYKHLWLPHIFLLVALAFSLFLIYKTFKNTRLRITPFALLFIALFPFSNEATLWLSAAIRSIPSLLFMAFTGLLIRQFITKNNFWLLLISILTSIAATLFYEPFIPLFFIYILVVIFVGERLAPPATSNPHFQASSLRREKFQFSTKRYSGLKFKFLSLIPIALAAIAFALFYLLISKNSHEVALRGGLIQMSDFLPHTQKFLTDLQYAFFTILPRLLVYKSWLLLILIPMFIFILHFSCRGGRPRPPSSIAWKTLFLNLLIGALLFIAALSINLVLADNPLSERLIFPSVLGLAIIIDGLLIFLTSLIKNPPIRKWAYITITSIILAVLALSTISKLDIYRKTNQIDNQIADQIIEKCDNLYNPTDGTIILSKNLEYFPQSVQFDTDTKLATSNYAAITGLCQLKTGKYIESIGTWQEGTTANIIYTVLNHSGDYYYLDENYILHKVDISADFGIYMNGTKIGQLDKIPDTDYTFKLDLY